MIRCHATSLNLNVHVRHIPATARQGKCRLVEFNCWGSGSPCYSSWIMGVWREPETAAHSRLVICFLMLDPSVMCYITAAIRATRCLPAGLHCDDHMQTTLLAQGIALFPLSTFAQVRTSLTIPLITSRSALPERKLFQLAPGNLSVTFKVIKSGQSDRKCAEVHFQKSSPHFLTVERPNLAGGIIRMALTSGSDRAVS